MQDTERRAFLRVAGLMGAMGFAGNVAGQETTTADGEQTENGLVTVSSDRSFDRTLSDVQTNIELNENLTLIEVVDHAQSAERFGMDLRPTTLLIFGNPRLGTQLMQAEQTAGIDLPQKMLVWEADDGSVYVTYNDPRWLAERHGIEGQEDTLNAISNALESLATSGN
ncbi:DUF302 domain-containing protein [Halorussus halophilus]|uniref:DUF302 domain-containing protein n=1 Tax=Halorussus halophilus TaxID=2650975 RepID=UPI00130170B3|nr:DUF302 domain-containing protein [Halorussus halophilus]